MNKSATFDHMPIHEGTPHGPYLPHPDLEPESVISQSLYLNAEEDSSIYQYMKIREGLIKAHLDPQNPVTEGSFRQNYDRINAVIEQSLDEKAEQQVFASVMSDENIRNSRHI